MHKNARGPNCGSTVYDDIILGFSWTRGKATDLELGARENIGSEPLPLFSNQQSKNEVNAVW